MSERSRPTRPSSTQMWDDSEGARSRDHKDREREPKDDRAGGNTPNERTPKDRHAGSKRSRSPRDVGRAESKRYRSRSPLRRDHRDRDGSRFDRGDRGDRNRDRDDNRRGAPPKGPRGGADTRRSDHRSGGPVRAPEKVKAEVKVDVKDEDEDTKDVPMDGRPEGMDDDTWNMYKMMGFVGFKSTKNTKVPGNDKNFAVRRDKKMEARQYMNRPGGFNRPLSPSRL